jgi:hypothetical protein
MGSGAGGNSSAHYATPIDALYDPIEQVTLIDLGLKGGVTPSQGYHPCTPFKKVKSKPWQSIVANYPTLAAADYDKIHAIQQSHDGLYFDVVAPHFTLVLPVFTVDETTFINHVEQIGQTIPSLDFVIRCATLGDDTFSDYTHVLLLPDEAYSYLVKLPDRPYTSILAPKLRLDIPFIRHIGIANDRAPQISKTIVDDHPPTKCTPPMAA